MTRSPLIGKPAPAFSLPDANGETYNLTPETAGVPIALFFYPKSGSYGCTREACDFRDALSGKEIFKTSKALVIGVSADPVDKQKEFVEKQKLTYPILSDSNGEARKTYHVGKGLLGLVDARMTFIIDAKGIVRDVLDNVMNYGAHVKFVNKWLEKLEEEERQANAPPPREPGLITEPGLATDEQEPTNRRRSDHPAPTSPRFDQGRDELPSAAAPVQT